MADIHYVTGDATDPQGDGPKIVVHVVNDAGRWGRGFVLAVSRRWPLAETAYRSWAAGARGTPFELGHVQFVPVGADVFVANLIGQHGIRSAANPVPVRYDAIGRGLARVAEYAREVGASVHMPWIGSGLAGGAWGEVEPIIRWELVAAGIGVTVYDLNDNP